MISKNVNWPAFELIANDKCWIEAEAIRGLEALTRLEGVERVVGLPDLHPGLSPVGVAVAARNFVHPFLLGEDLGCGMSLFETGISIKKFKPEKAAGILEALESLAAVEVEFDFEEPSPIKNLGSIGGGNHFLEFQAAEKITDKKVVEKMDLDPGRILILVHSGSRDFGRTIYEKCVQGLDGLPQGSAAAQEYLALHDQALKWASRNRLLVAKKVLTALAVKEELRLILDIAHNYLEPIDDLIVHRKGAVSALKGPVVIPGSRGTVTSLFNPAPDTAKSLFSLSHGAGRKWRRCDCRGRLEAKWTRQELRRTALGSHVICTDKATLYEEAPQAYKNVAEILKCLEQNGLGKVIMTLAPLLTYKL
ncbi:MAG: RNA ligase RtcB family protein [Deltaproteobacteria bacterium]|jgi:release factor H-coupled RctB family protein|nr:RNA ligase RtcB family protein [Deltaproteobacteria bacterium]